MPEPDAADDGARGPETAAAASRLTRRSSLAALSAVTSATALAGCADRIDSFFESVGEVPTIDLANERLVQTVTDTRVQGASGSPTTLDDPPLVEGYPVAPLFDISGQNLDNLDELELELDVDGGPTSTFELPSSDLQDIDAGADTAAVFTDVATAGNSPTVTLTEGAASVTVSAKEPDSGATLDTVLLSATNDYTSVAPNALRVGFVGVQDPDDGSNFGAGNNGELVDFSRSARMAHRYLVATYPGGIVSFSYENGTITGDPDDRSSDYSDAYTTLQKAAKGEHSSRPNFPNGGTFRNDSHLSDADARTEVETHGFDVAVLILPDDYYDKLGLYPGSRKQAVSILEPEANGTRWDEAEFTHTVAQEIGHNLRDKPYTDPSEHPLAQRASKGSDADVNGTPVDRDHARHENSQGGDDPPGVTSVGYDLTDGQFATVDSTEYDAAGDFSVGGRFGSGSRRSVGRLESFMSYSWNDVWTDARMHADLIDSEFQRDSWGSPSDAVLAATGHLTDAGVAVFDDVVTYFGPVYVPDGTVENVHRGQQVADADTDTATVTETPAERDAEEVPGRETTGEPEYGGEPTEVVTVELIDPDGEPLVTAHVRDRIRPFHSDEILEVPHFLVAFPPRTVAVRSLRADRTSTFNPITRVVGDAVDRIPARGLRGEAAVTRDRIRAALDGVREAMTDDDYARATAEMDEQVREAVGQGVRGEYADAGSNQPFRADVLTLVDRMVERLGGLAADQPEEPADTGSITLRLPGGSTRSVAPVEGQQPVSEYYGYDTGPPDSANTPDGLERNDATVSFVYRNAETGALSLVVINGDARTASDGGGEVPISFSGVSGPHWQVRDGPHGSGGGDADTYETAEGPLEGTESVIWTWDDSNTDGGAIGPLGEDFEIDVVHRVEWAVRDRAAARSGLDEWVFVDGADLANPVQLATFGPNSGDVAVRIAGSQSTQ